MKKVLFIFSGARSRLADAIKKHEAPDTQLYGMNHMSSDFTVTSKEFADTFLAPLGKILGFRLRHTLMFFWTRSADIVFGSSLYYMLPLKKLFPSRSKFVLLNISLNRFLAENSKKPRLYQFILSYLKSLDAIVSLSHIQLEELTNKHGIDSSKLKYISLGVDTIFYEPVFEGRSDYLLSVGRDNGRDYKTLFEVARLLPDRQFHCVLSKRNLVEAGDIPANVTIFFDISILELKKKYAEAQALILTTHPDGHRDGSDCSGQTVLLDAFASGLPVIASRKAYIADYALEDKEIMLVDCYKPEQIVQSINSISTRAVAHARAARSRVESEFSSQKMGEQLSNLFRTL